MLELNDVTKRYPSPKEAEDLLVLDQVCLKVEAGMSMAVVGPSGCGKSTLLNIMGALDKPTAGQVIFRGRRFDEQEDRELTELRRTEIGFVFQLHHLLPQCTVLENVLLPTLADKQTPLRQKREKAVSLLEKVGLGDFGDYSPGRLSGGQRQRVAVARALINSPGLLLADEPTGSLDMHTSQSIMDLLCGLNRDEGLAMVLVTHSLEQAERMQVVRKLKNGKLEDMK